MGELITNANGGQDRGQDRGHDRRHGSGGDGGGGSDGREDGLTWVEDADGVDLVELSNLYRVAPLGEKPPEALATVFGNSMFVCFVYADDVLIGAGRVLADGVDCAYVADVAVHPDQQGKGLGARIVRRLVERSSGHKKIILYARPGTESFYQHLGFLRMNTAMAVWSDPGAAVRSGLLRAEE